MPDSYASVLICSLALAASGCASLQAQPGAEIDAVPEGYNCFRQQTNPVGAVSKDYLCVFALDTPSTYYAKSSRDDVLHAFISKLGGTCSIGKTWEMEDPHRANDHDLVLIATAIRCP